MNEQRFFLLLLGATSLYALWKGGAPEKIGAAAFLIATFLSVLATMSEWHRFVHVEIGLLAIDTALFAALLWLAFRSTRWWPLFTAGFQLDDVVIHVMRSVAPDTLQMAYLHGTALWSYPMIITLGIGTWRHRKRLKTAGCDPAWLDRETVSRRTDRSRGK